MACQIYEVRILNDLTMSIGLDLDSLAVAYFVHEYPILACKPLSCELHDDSEVDLNDPEMMRRRRKR